jgi:hypothetical protein
MKKIVALFAFVAFFHGATAIASPERGTPEYAKLQEYKKVQREQREREKADPSSKKPGFWAREGSRSGLTGTGNMFGGIIGNVIPGEKPGSRSEKTASSKRAPKTPILTSVT